MATQRQLKDARNAGLNLAHVTQEYAQGDIALATEDNAAARAEVKAVADAAITAATAIGGSGAPAPATETRVTNGQELTGVTPTGTYISKVTFTVAGGVITAITLS